MGTSSSITRTLPHEFSSIRRSELVGGVIIHDALLWIGGKRTGTYIFLHSLQLPLLPPSRCHQLLKLMATRWHLMAGDAALRLRIASNTIEIEVYKLRLSNF